MKGWARGLRLAGAIVAVLVLYFAVPLSTSVDRSAVAGVLLCIVAVALLGALVLWQVRLELVVPEHRIDGLVLALVVCVLGFALAFYLLETRNPGEVAGLQTRLDALYFAVSTLLTVGYGDVHAAGQAARSLALVQMIFDVVVIAAGATRLTSRMRSTADARAEARRRAREQAKEQAQETT